MIPHFSKLEMMASVDRAWRNDEGISYTRSVGLPVFRKRFKLPITVHGDYSIQIDTYKAFQKTQNGRMLFTFGRVRPLTGRK